MHQLIYHITRITYIRDHRYTATVIHFSSKWTRCDDILKKNPRKFYCLAASMCVWTKTFPNKHPWGALLRKFPVGWRITRYLKQLILIITLACRCYARPCSIGLAYSDKISSHQGISTQTCVIYCGPNVAWHPHLHGIEPSIWLPTVCFCNIYTSPNVYNRQQ